MCLALHSHIPGTSTLLLEGVSKAGNGLLPVYLMRRGLSPMVPSYVLRVSGQHLQQDHRSLYQSCCCPYTGSPFGPKSGAFFGLPVITDAHQRELCTDCQFRWGPRLVVSTVIACHSTESQRRSLYSLLKSRKRSATGSCANRSRGRFFDLPYITFCWACKVRYLLKVGSSSTISRMLQVN